MHWWLESSLIVRMGRLPPFPVVPFCYMSVVLLLRSCAACLNWLMS